MWTCSNRARRASRSVAVVALAVMAFAACVPTPPEPVAKVHTAWFPVGAVGREYTADLTGGSNLAGGETVFTLQGLPAGLALGPGFNSWRVSGTPTQSGTFQVVIHVNDGYGNEASRTVPMTIRPAGASIAFDRLTTGDGASVRPRMSADGRMVVFGSYATDLPITSTIGGGTGTGIGVFVFDTMDGTVHRLSRGQSAPTGPQPWSISWDGSYVAFESDSPDLDPDSPDDNGVSDIFLWGGRRITDGNGPSTGPSIDHRGEYVAFTSAASDLVPGDTNGVEDVFLATWNPPSMTRLSGDDGGSDVSLSPDAGFATYNVPAGLQLLEIGTGVRTLISTTPASSSEVSLHGDEIVFQTAAGVQLWKRSTGTSQVLSAATDSPPVISKGGDFVAYEVRSGGGAPVQSNIVVQDTATGTTQPITSGPGISTNPSFDGQGLHLTFQSDTTGLVPDDDNGLTDVFIWRRPT